MRHSLYLRVRQYRDDRPQKDLDYRIQSRTKMVQESYDAWLEKNGVRKTLYRPQANEVTTFPELKELIHADQGRPLLESDIRPCMRRLPAMIQDWQARRKPALAALISTPLFQASASLDVPNVMDLAVATFTCENLMSTRPWSCTLFSWTDIKQHICSKPMGDSCLRFCRESSATAESLLRMQGLDPLLTTAAQMDALDKKFVCENCPPRVQREPDWTVVTYTVLSWRDCVIFQVLPSIN
jgi:hypothetical protein